MHKPSYLPPLHCKVLYSLYHLSIPLFVPKCIHPRWHFWSPSPIFVSIHSFIWSKISLGWQNIYPLVIYLKEPSQKCVSRVLAGVGWSRQIWSKSLPRNITLSPEMGQALAVIWVSYFEQNCSCNQTCMVRMDIIQFPNVNQKNILIFLVKWKNTGFWS